MIEMRRDQGFTMDALAELLEMERDPLAPWVVSEYLGVAAARADTARAVSAAEIHAHCEALSIGGERRELLLAARMPMFAAEQRWSEENKESVPGGAN